MPPKKRTTVVVSKARVSKPHKPLPNDPPKFNASIYVKHKFRYINIYNTVTPNSCVLTTLDLISLLSMVASTTTISSIISSYRLVKIELWQTGSTGEVGSGTISLEPNAGGTSSSIGGQRSINLSATSNTNNSNARFRYVPGKETTLGMWQNSLSSTTATGTGTITINSNVGDTMDITIEFELINADPMVVTTYTTTSNTGSIIVPTLPISGTPLTIFKATDYLSQ